MTTTISALIKALQMQRDTAQHEVDRLDQALAAVQGLSGSRATKTVGRPAGKRRKMSAAGRAAIAAAQRLRWAKQRKGKAKAAVKRATKPRKKYKLSAAGRAKIVAAAKARAAKQKAAKDKVPF